MFRLTPCMLFIASSIMAQNCDLLIKNGKIIDGSGNPWFYGDIAVDNGKIVAIVHAAEWKAARVIDAGGRIVSPGFIDVHTHIEGNDLKVPTADNFIYDGVTSVVTGNCGSSNVDVGSYFRQIDSVRTSINVATLIGHNSVRKAVMGEEMRDPSPEEQQQMESIVSKAMEDGAVGFSTGLIYVPGTYSKTPEVVGLASAASRHHGVYASHIRDEEGRVTEAIEEAIHIGREARMPVEISHFKVTYKPNWGRADEIIALVEKARSEGVDVTVDQYPYVASSTTLNTRLPSWALSGGQDSIKFRLSNPTTRSRIKKEMLKDLKEKKEKNYSYALVAQYLADTAYNGKTITEINRMMGRKSNGGNETETIMDMVANGSASMIFFSMNEEDLRHIMRYPYNMIASDAGVVRAGNGMPHPRAYGTNARVLAEYVRKQKLIKVEEAVRRMTSLPAQKFQLKDRGLLRAGMAADILVWDLLQVSDPSTFVKPHAYTRGMDYVIVNGQVTIDQGRHAGVRAGSVLRGPGYVSNSN